MPREEGNLTLKDLQALESTCSPKATLCHESKKAEIEQLWLELFSDPTEWQDHRLDKANPRFPDFKHTKQTYKALWLNSGWIPTWVKEKLAALPPGTILLSSFSWNQRLSRYNEAGQYQKTVELFQQMQQDGQPADRFTFPTVLKACAGLGLTEYGRLIHTMMQPGLETNLFVGSSLVDMYAKCGSIEEAERVFNQMSARDVVAWTAMILGYVKCGEGQKALELFAQMQQLGVDPDRLTFVGVLNACASTVALEGGRRAHEAIIQRGYESDTVVGNSLIDMYTKCGSIEEAERVFNKMPMRTVVAWNAMIFGYVKCGEGQKALELFERMPHERVDPDNLTFVGVLNACASVNTLEGGRHAHGHIICRGFESDIVVGNSLVDMYVKCGSMEEAERVFKGMPKGDVVAWNALILGYVKCGEGWNALELYEQMKQQGFDPTPVTFVGVVNACASVAALEEGRRIHDEIICKGFKLDVVVGNSLVDMYAKCGSVEEAESVFNEMPTRDVVAWNALLAAYGSHGYTRTALEAFEQMCEIVSVTSVTFVSLLSACSHGGLVDEGLEYFKSMSAGYNIPPTVEHYACLVDILGRAGRLSEAEDLLMCMPMDPNAMVWKALLSACRAHLNVEVGQHCAERVLELDPENSSGYVLLADIYFAAGKSKSSLRDGGWRL